MQSDGSAKSSYKLLPKVKWLWDNDSLSLTDGKAEADLNWSKNRNIPRCWRKYFCKKRWAKTEECWVSCDKNPCSMKNNSELCVLQIVRKYYQAEDFYRLRDEIEARSEARNLDTARFHNLVRPNSFPGHTGPCHFLTVSIIVLHAINFLVFEPSCCDSNASNFTFMP